MLILFSLKPVTDFHIYKVLTDSHQPVRCCSEHPRPALLLWGEDGMRSTKGGAAGRVLHA